MQQPPSYPRRMPGRRTSPPTMSNPGLSIQSPQRQRIQEYCRVRVLDLTGDYFIASFLDLIFCGTLVGLRLDPISGAETMRSVVRLVLLLGCPDIASF